MRHLAKAICKEGGFRFAHTSTAIQSTTYRYHCSQDMLHSKSYQPATEVEKRRDGRRMARLPCDSKLNIRPFLQSRTLTLSVHHEWHAPYEDIQLSQLYKN